MTQATTTVSTRTFLGIDGGGTSTRAWLVDDAGRLLGRGRAGPSNPNNVGFAAAVRAIVAAAEAARAPNGATKTPADAAFVACAGLKTAADGDAFAEALRPTQIATQVVAANDTEAALAGGLGGAPGIALVCGTGSFCLGRDASGRVARCGGWGWLLDDIGSGFWIGREAVRAVALAADRRSVGTRMHAAVLAHFGVAEPDALLSSLYGPNRNPVDLAKLAPLVCAAALDGDAPASGILLAGAHGIAELVRHVADELSWSGPVPLIIVGGTGRSGPPYTPMLHAALRAAVPTIEIREPMLPPVAGAALRALELGGISPSPELLARFLASRHHDAID
jgi:N-acetylglucosamine kinase-like BadF-type ATPase